MLWLGQQYDWGKEWSGQAAYWRTNSSNFHLLLRSCSKPCSGRYCQKFKLMRLCLDAVFEITKLIKKFTKPGAIFQKLKHDLATDTPSFCILCPTRWTVCTASPQRVLDNYEVLLGVWEESKNSQIDSEMMARIIGIETQMLTFNFLFGISLGILVLQHSDNLSKSLQHDTITASEGQQLAKLTIDVIKSIRKEDKFKSFYDRVLLHQSKFDIDATTLSHKRHAPRQLQIGLTDGSFHSTPEHNYRQIYYEAPDLVIESINSRFNQPGYNIYCNVEDLVLIACRECLYGTVLKMCMISTRMTSPKCNCRHNCLSCKFYFLKRRTNQSFQLTISLIKSLSQLFSAQRLAFINVWVLMKMLLVMPATNASSEHPFSGLRRIKTSLRTKITQKRLNDLMVRNIHKEKNDLLNLAVVAKEFVSSRENKVRLFGDLKLSS